MISELIANYAKLGMQGVLCITVVWLVWYLVRSVMGMFKNELKQLHLDSANNAELNREAIVLLKDGRKESRSEHLEITKALKNISDFHNGKNPTIREHEKRLRELEGKE